MRPRIIACLALLAGLVAATTTGCAGGQPAPPAAATPPPAPATPKDALLASVPGAATGSFRFTLKSAETNLSGSVDPAGKTMEVTTAYEDASSGFTMTMVLRLIDQQAWMKVRFTNPVPGLPKLPKKWLRLDRTKMDDPDEVLSFDDPDPASAAALFNAIVDVRQSAPGTYQGTVDLTRATGADVADADTLAALGNKAKSLPLRAAVDGSGRLTRITVAVPAAGKKAAYQFAAAYTDYGAATRIGPPAAADEREAPAEAYEILNG